MSQVNRTCTLNKSLGVAYVSEVLNKSLEENALMRQRNNKVIVKCKLLGTRKFGTFFNNYSQPEEYFSTNIATGLKYNYELRHNNLMQFSCNWFILQLNFQYNTFL